MNAYRQKQIAQIIIACATLSIGCLASAATEEATDKMLFKCTFKHRDTTFNSDGSYKRASVYRASSGQLGIKDATTTGTQANQRFTMVWRGYSDDLGNSWFIMPGDQASCLGYHASSTYPFTAETTGCATTDYWYVKRHDSYYVISFSPNYVDSWRIPAGRANSANQVISANDDYDPNAALATRRTFHWEIRDCVNQAGSFVAPNFN